MIFSVGGDKSCQREAIIRDFFLSEMHRPNRPKLILVGQQLAYRLWIRKASATLAAHMNPVRAWIGRGGRRRRRRRRAVHPGDRRAPLGRVMDRCATVSCPHTAGHKKG